MDSPGVQVLTVHGFSRSRSFGWLTDGVSMGFRWLFGELSVCSVGEWTQKGIHVTVGFLGGSCGQREKPGVHVLYCMWLLGYLGVSCGLWIH